MKLLFPAVVVLTVLGLPATAAQQNRSAGSKYFDQVDRVIRDGVASNLEALAERGWAAVQSAGPADAGFLQGVHTAHRIFRALGRELRADAVYTEAEALCDTPALNIVKLRLQYMHVFQLIRRSRFVDADAVLRSSIAAENAAERKSPLYVAFLQSLAYVREQEGDLEGAEALYQSTISLARPSLSAVVIDNWFTGKEPNAFIGEPRASMAVFYQNHGRFKQAEVLYREEVARHPDSGDERIGALNSLSSFLQLHGSKEEALAIQHEVLRLRTEGASRNPRWKQFAESDQYALANLEVDAGHGDDAKLRLETALRQAEVEHGKSSPQYEQALKSLYENRRYARDYDAAEAAARELLKRAEGDESERGWALSRLADVRKAQGKEEEAEALSTQASEIIRKTLPLLPSSHRREFENASAMVKAGKPDEAVEIATEIANGKSHVDDQSEFETLARLLATEYKPQAVKVASIAVASAEAAVKENPNFAGHLLDWANFYDGELEQPDRASEIVGYVETIITRCCGATSRLMERVLETRAQVTNSMEGEGAGIRYLEKLRDLRSKIYGEDSQQVEWSTMQLAMSNADADWPVAAKLYFKVIDISTRRTGSWGNEYVSQLDSVATAFFDHDDIQTALALNQRAIDHAANFFNSDEVKKSLLEHRKQMKSRRSPIP